MSEPDQRPEPGQASQPYREPEGVRTLDVRLPDGRVQRVHDDGEPGDDRVPLVYHHGTPSSGLLLDLHVAAARERGLRLVAADRPGVGGSTRRPGRRVADVAADVAAVADALGLDRFVTQGLSGGGPHALATAALLPDRVAAAVCQSGVAPYRAPGLDWLAGMGEDNLTEFGAAAAGEAQLRPLLTAMRDGLAGSAPDDLAAEMASLMPPADLRAMDVGLAGWLHASMVEALAPGVDGWLDDDLAFVADWGFSLADLRVPVLVVAGAQDLMVPFAHAGWLAEHVPGAQTRLTPDDGHLSPLLQVGEVLDWLLTRW